MSRNPKQEPVIEYRKTGYTFSNEDHDRECFSAGRRTRIIPRMTVPCCSDLKLAFDVVNIIFLSKIRSGHKRMFYFMFDNWFIRGDHKVRTISKKI